MVCTTLTDPADDVPSTLEPIGMYLVLFNAAKLTHRLRASTFDDASLDDRGVAPAIRNMAETTTPTPTPTPTRTNQSIILLLTNENA